MKFNIILLSTAIFGAQQIIAAPMASASPSASISVSVSNAAKALPAAISTLAASTMLPSIPADGTITLDTHLVQELGWSQKDTDVLTAFLNSIERLGDLTAQVFDPATQQLLTDFQAEARELIANAGYKYQPATDGTHRRILSRISGEDATVYHPQGIPEVVEKLVQVMTNLLDKLKKKADSGSVFAQKVLTIVNNILTTIGKKIEEHLFPKETKSGSDSSSSKPSFSFPTF